MNYLWGGMLLLGIAFGVATGRGQEVTQAILTSSKEAVDLCIVMLGIVGFWNGMMNIAWEIGLLERWTKKMMPFLKFLFPNLIHQEKALSYIASNFVANILGLGWAATPAGLRAMEELRVIKEARGESEERASDEMCTFLVLNLSSLQLIPINMIAYRNQYGSTDPTMSGLPGMIATMVNTICAIVYCKMKNRRIFNKKQSH